MRATQSNIVYKQSDVLRFNHWVRTIFIWMLSSIAVLFLQGCATTAEFPDAWTSVIMGQNASFMQRYQWCFSSLGPGMPAGGMKVFHPRLRNVVYYFTCRDTMERISQKTTGAGLWKSEDNGKTWRRLNTGIPDFYWLFIHPYTDTMYASVCEYPVLPFPDGILAMHSRSKIIVSTDGENWKDISPVDRQGTYGPLFIDPDSSNRICACSTYPNGVLQSDDEYRQWHFYTNDEWEKNHKGWDWKAFYTSLSVSGIVEPGALTVESQ